MAGLGDLAREYEAARFPADRRVDLHAEGPQTARERALQWIQSRAHEEPGQEFLLIVERGRGPRRPPTPVRLAVEKLLRELDGKLIEWWQEFAPGSIAVRIARDPAMWRGGKAPAAVPDEGRTPETSGVALLALHHDIPPKLQSIAGRAAEMRRQRDGISVRLLDSVLRRIWIEAQAIAMSERITVEAALERIEVEERRREAEEF